MYQLVSRIPDGLIELRTLLEEHITQQGLSAIERGGETAHNDPKVLLIAGFGKLNITVTYFLMIFRFTLRPFWMFIGSTMHWLCQLLTMTLGLSPP